MEETLRASCVVSGERIKQDARQCILVWVHLLHGGGPNGASATLLPVPVDYRERHPVHEPPRVVHESLVEALG